MKNKQNKLLLAGYLVILAINFILFITGGPLLQTDSPFRMVAGSLMIFLLPGLIWCEIIGFRSEHFMETIALSFAMTVSIGILLIPVPFIFHATIKLWVALLFAVSAVGVLVLLLSRRNRELEFLPPLYNSFKNYPSNISSLLILLLPAVMSYGAYKWGENIVDIDGEKLIHLTYLRYYFDMPMVLNDLGITKGAPPQNLVHVWEYFLAGWASLTHMDPLPLFYRSRFIVPFIGLSAMFFLIKNIFTKAVKAEIIFWAVLVMSLGWFALLSPSNLDWIKQDPLRGLMSFMGTAHHADTAMELLIPLGAGLVLLAFRQFGWRSLLLLTGVLITAFMWHVREFFQLAVYTGVFGLALLLFPNTERKALLKKWGAIMAVFAGVVIIFGLFMLLVLPKAAGLSGELKIKELALSYALLPENILGFGNLFNFPVDLRLTQGLDINAILNSQQIAAVFKAGKNYFLWLLLSAIAIPVVSFLGRKEDRQLSLFFILLWFLALCWNFSMLLLIVLTYSEINFTTPRIIYLFSFIMTANALYLSMEAFRRRNFDEVVKSRHSGLSGIILLAGLLALGILFKIWWAAGLPLISVASVVLSLFAVICFIFLLVPKPQEEGASGPNHFWVSVLGIFVFFLPVLGQEYLKLFKNVFTAGRPAIEWSGNNNPFGFSRDLLSFIRTLPPQKTFVVNPLGKAAVSVYAPQYLAVPPEILGGTIINLIDRYKEARQGRHPLFTTNIGVAQLNPSSITKPPAFKANFMDWKGPDTVLNDIAKAAPPMVLHSRSSDFIFRRVPDKAENILRVSVSPDGKAAQRSLSFGYALKDNGFNPDIRPGQEIVFVVSARRSGSARNTAQLFIIDRAQTAEMNGDNINGSSWKQYLVRKPMRAGINYVAFGIQWQPENEKEWLEIKDVRIYIMDSLLKNYSAPLLSVDYKAVNELLGKYAADYVLVEKDYYSNLLPYFQRFPKAYEIVFDNKENGELIVKYLLKPA